MRRSRRVVCALAALACAYAAATPALAATVSSTAPATEEATSPVAVSKATVTLDANGGTGSRKLSAQVGQAVALPSAMRVGYEFVGWGTTKDGGKLYRPGQRVEVTGDMTLYARWEQARFKVVAKLGTGVRFVSGTGTYKAGQSVKLSAALLPGYEFDRWQVSGTGASISPSKYDPTTATLVVGEGDVTVTATAKQAEGTVAVAVKPGTGVRAISGAGTYKAGQRVKLTATLLPGYVFDRWQVSGSGASISSRTSNPATLVVGNRDVTVTAIAKQDGTAKQATPKVTVKPGMGVRSISGAGTYKAGQRVMLTATLLPGYEFDRWQVSGAGASISPSKYDPTTATLVVGEGNVTVTATAKRATPKVTVKPGMGVRSISGAGTYKAGQRVQLVATLLPGYVFDRWEVSGVDAHLTSLPTSNPATLIVGERDVTVTAIVRQEGLSTVAVKPGTGVSSISGAGTYKAGQSVELTAALLPGYAFDRWQVSGTGAHLTSLPTSNPATLVVGEGNVTVTAKVKQVEFKVAVRPGTGVSSVSGAGTYEAGQSVELTATLLPGYAFDRWEVSGSGASLSSRTSNPATLVVGKRDVTVRATAKRTEAKVTVKPGTGVSSISGAGTYKVGQRVELTATLLPGYEFDRWQVSGAGASLSSPTSNPATLVVGERDVTVTAKAKRAKATVTLDANGGTGSRKRSAQVGQTVMLPSAMRAGYEFVGWGTTKDGGTLYKAHQRVEVTGDMTLYAQWKERASKQ